MGTQRVPTHNLLDNCHKKYYFYYTIHIDSFLDINMSGVSCDRTPSPDLGKTMKRNLKKPMMEKRRRDRINTSLTQLKNLVLEAMNKDTSQYSKLEKADILE